MKLANRYREQMLKLKVGESFTIPWAELEKTWHGSRPTDAGRVGSGQLVWLMEPATDGLRITRQLDLPIPSAIAH